MSSIVPDFANAPPTPDELTRLLRELALPEVKRNPQRRIEICRRALALITPEQKAHWLALRKELGDALFLDRSARRPESLEEAIPLLREVLGEYPPETPASFRVPILESLGNALRNRLRGPRAENLEEAIEHYRLALTLLNRGDDSEAWARLHGSLGMAYSDRIRGDRSENLELARAAYEQALEVFTRDRFPIEWAVTAHNLANVLRDLRRGNPEANLEAAIRLYEESLEVRTREANAVQWAMTLHNLAIACRRRVRGSSEANIDRAIALSLQALEIRTRESSPLRWAQTLCTLGNAWAERPHGDPAANLRNARKAYESALEVMTPENTPFDAAVILRNLGKIRGLLHLSHNEGTADEAIAACQAALQIHRVDTAPLEHREAADILGMIHFGLSRWSEAAAAFSSALEASEILYQAGPTPDSRDVELREGRNRGARTAYALARSGRLAESVEILERSRVRALGEALARDEALLDEAREEHRKAFQEAREQIRILEAEARGASSGEDRSFLAIAGELRAVRERLSELVQAIRREIPGFFEEGLRFGGICQVATSLGCPLIQLLTVTWGSLALVVPPGAETAAEVFCVWIDSFNEHILEHLLFQSSRPLLPEREGGQEESKTALEDIWSLGYWALLDPLATLLESRGFDRAVLLPAGRLSLLPLHAVIDDRILLTTAPSARLLQACISRARERRNRPPGFLGVGTSAPSEPLPFVRREVEAAAIHFPPEGKRLLLDGAATHSSVFSEMAGASHLHFACHGTFEKNDPLRSALHLAAGDRLTLRELLDGRPDLSAARLAVLSACRSGLSDYLDLPDESIGFPAVLLQAGIPAVIGTLWPVADVSSALLMGRFYEIHLKEGLPAGEALRAAQRWLRQATAADLALADQAEELLAEARTPAERAIAYQRLRRFRARPDLRPYSHPYYWAGYFLTGDPGEAISS
jgi:CHAT domain-containing protein/tetratricopeptide (TPR) repeat protein